MEEKKLDLNSIIGFVLIFGILIWIMYQNQPSDAQIKADKVKKEQAATQAKKETAAVVPIVKDSIQDAKATAALGNFAYSAGLHSATNAVTTIENELIRIQVANKGGQIVSATLKKHERFKKGSKELVSLVEKNNAQLNINLSTQDNRTLSTKDLYFQPTLTKSGKDQLLTMRLKSSETAYLEYQYVLKADNYMLDFSIQTQGLQSVLNTSKPVNLEWELKTLRNEKGVDY